jgi:hypothetical protein
MKLKRIIHIEHHRNGIAGAPFHAVLFEDRGEDASRKLGVVFDAPGHVAVLDVAKLAAGDIAFRCNSWRGDRYEPMLRMAITHSHTQRALPGGELTNQVRSQRAEQVLSTYADYDTKTNLVDFLADSMHWCQAKGHDFLPILAAAVKHFAVEVSGEKGVKP